VIICPSLAGHTENEGRVGFDGAELGGADIDEADGVETFELGAGEPEIYGIETV